MATLREIKTRIGSVKSTLKITGAMKLVASIKLQKAQRKLLAIVPYEEALRGMLRSLPLPAAFTAGPRPPAKPGVTRFVMPDSGNLMPDPDRASLPRGKTAVLAIASNNSLCGAFNHKVIAAALDEVHSLWNSPVDLGLLDPGDQEKNIAHLDPGDQLEVIPVGRKMGDAMHHAGFSFENIIPSLSGDPSYEEAAHLADKIVARFLSGEYSRVIMVYTHYLTPASQRVTVEQFLPLAGAIDHNPLNHSAGTPSEDWTPTADQTTPSEDWIVEPDAEALAGRLLPEVLRVRLYATLLDSAAAEHAARTMSMQAATDNANNLIDELTLQYNKGRQQKITAEILDLSR